MAHSAKQGSVDASESELEDRAIRSLLEAVFRHYGWDFRDYAPTFIRRRIRNRIREEQVNSIPALQERILRDSACMERFLLTLSVDVTAMFRDPSFSLALRRKVVPFLRTYPFVRIWHAGCGRGEEVYSLGILLREEGLHEKALVYATDMNEDLLNKAREGILPLKTMQDYTRNYLKAGGTRAFSDYYAARYDYAIIDRSLRENVTWAQHNLVTDGVFNEFNVILCRNVMIYFNQVLQGRVHRLLYESLGLFGILGVGGKESLKFTPHEPCYEELDGREKLYRKVR